jgi:phosphoribosylformylglycinamidine synthase subunit PurQ / glutaminase
MSRGSVCVTIRSSMKFGVVAWYAVSHNLGQKAEFIWHDATHLGNIDAVILPGGFAYGDYLRCGAIAKFSPVMQAIRRFADPRRPGAGHPLSRRGLKFICKPLALRVAPTNLTPHHW